MYLIILKLFLIDEYFLYFKVVTVGVQLMKVPATEKVLQVLKVVIIVLVFQKENTLEDMAVVRNMAIENKIHKRLIILN